LQGVKKISAKPIYTRFSKLMLGGFFLFIGKNYLKNITQSKDVIFCKNLMGGFMPTCLTQTFVKKAK
jgi:hypothetical protein|tara:strand:- start:106 stop:306 length:201 start_codon:yes stop_codon:yes gene_type:complete